LNETHQDFGHDNIVQRLERYFLEQAGYSVEFANDGLTALKRAQELKPADTALPTQS
jgi:CheY-like chemotaxis protein